MLKKSIAMLVICLLSGLFHCYAKTDFFYGSQTKEDHYSWMEVEQPRTTQWLNVRTKQSRKILDALPWRITLEKELNTFVRERDTPADSYDVGGAHFYLQSTPSYPYLRLFVKHQNDKEKLLIDPPFGSGISFFSPSDDGIYVAYGLSEIGHETTDIKIINVTNGKILEDVIPQVCNQYVRWHRDGASFFYTKKSHDKIKTTAGHTDSERIYLHQIGKSYKSDQIIFDMSMASGLNAENHDNDSVNLYTSPDSEWFIASISPSITGYSYYLYSARGQSVNQQRGKWSKLIDIDDKVSEFIFSGKWLYLARYNLFSGYNITRLNLDKPQSHEEKILEWSNGELTGLTTSSDALYITYHDSGARRFIRVPFDNIHDIQNIPRPFDGEVTAMFSSADPREISFTMESWTEPPRTFLYNPDTQSVKDTGLITPEPYSFSDYQVEEKWVTSTNNVRVPLTIIRRRGAKLDSSAPTWLSAYGAYGESSFPNFDPLRLIWLERGGVIAIAHVRGGGELGPAWHEGGRASNKENSISDFINCAEYLVDNHYTTPSKLVISGQSAGGVVIGMAIVQHPMLFAAAAIDVGMLNMSRLDKIPIGQMNFKEFGSPYTKQGIHDLLKIDAYHNLQDGVRYPAVLLTVGLKDERVSPWQTAKFAARMEEINKKEKFPVLIVAEENAGHSSGTYAQADTKFLDMLSFFLWKTETPKGSKG